MKQARWILVSLAFFLINASPHLSLAEDTDAVAKQCEAESRALLEAMDQSQQRACAASTECVVVTNPLNLSEENARVIHVDDLAWFEAKMTAFLEQCREYVYMSPTEESFFMTVEPQCLDSRCQELTTTFTIGDD